MGLSMVLDSFAEGIRRRGLSVDGIQVIQDGETVGRLLFSEDVPHCVYSAGKGFISTAAGIALDEGLLSLGDRPAEMFGEHLPDRLADGYERITLKHLLTMSSGHDRALLMEKERLQLTETDWIRYFFEQPLVYEPGSKFVYSNASSYLASCMVEKVTGSKLQDFVYERIFKPLDIPWCRWLDCPMGHTFSPTGLYMRLGDLIKLGVLYLGGGEYRGSRVVSGDYVEAATKKQIESSQICPVGEGEDELYGYGYQFWMCRYPGIYRAYGRLGQFVIVVPDRNAVIATLADEPDVQGILDTVWETVLPQL